ncbi:MAG: putative motility protein [Anaerolineaceae bacterium]|nr:putative motility protein [Anaerolineaceae bacterium]
MTVSGTSMEDVLASSLTNRSNTQIRNEISMAVLKNQMDQHEAQAAALVKMIQNSSLDGTGQIVNRTA